VRYKILIDENLSRRLSTSFNDSLFESLHISAKNLLHVPDISIWNFASSEGYNILTKDWDYKFLSIAFGCPPKVIRLNCGNKTTSYINNLLQEKIEIITEFLSSEDDCYLEIE